MDEVRLVIIFNKQVNQLINLKHYNIMKVLIIDIETSGFLKDSGKIVEIGVVELCLNTGKKEIVFDKVINPGLSEDELNKSWIVSSGFMTAEEILAGVTFESIKDDLQKIIGSYTNGATAFNRSFDFDFLESYGIEFINKLPCPMKQSTNVCKIPKTGKAAFYPGYKWPNVEEAYKFFLPESNYNELHRGADDAFHEADIVFELHKQNLFL